MPSSSNKSQGRDHNSIKLPSLERPERSYNFTSRNSGCASISPHTSVVEDHERIIVIAVQTTQARRDHGCFSRSQKFKAELLAQQLFSIAAWVDKNDMLALQSR